MNDAKTAREALNGLLFPVPLFDDVNWLMTNAERSALTLLCDRLRPAVSIEVGTHRGGSLAVLAHYSAKVYALELETWAQQNLASRFPNVTFITGNSNDKLGPALADIAARKEALSLVLLDGSKNREGETADIERLLDYRPVTPLYIVMHDGFNPEIRSGIRGARWERSPFVHWIELDFVPGYLHESPEAKNEMWSGLALAVMLPRPREGELRISESNGRVFQSMLRVSAHRTGMKDFFNRCRMKIAGLFGRART